MILQPFIPKKKYNSRKILKSTSHGGLKKNSTFQTWLSYCTHEFIVSWVAYTGPIYKQENKKPSIDWGESY